MTRVFTTGQVARIFSVNINTVIKWFDEQKLKGFRLPRSNERRIYRESVVEFMREHDISLNLLAAFDEELLLKKKGRGRKTAPRAKTGAELRTFTRKPVSLRATLSAPDFLAEVTVSNLSMGGLYITGFQSKKNMIPEEFTLSVEGAKDLNGTCQLVHLRRASDATMALGCRFLQVNPGSLQNYLSAI